MSCCMKNHGDEFAYALLQDFFRSRRRHVLKLRWEQGSLETVLDPRGILGITIGLLKRGYRMISPQGCLHFWKDCLRYEHV